MSTSLPFTFEYHSPPKVEIEEHYAVSLFNPRKIADRYPGIFTPGNVYLQITSKTCKDQPFTGPTGTVTLELGQTDGYNFPVDEVTPYVFELAGTTPSQGTPTVKTRTPPAELQRDDSSLEVRADFADPGRGDLDPCRYVLAG